MEECFQIEDNGILQLAQSLVELHDEALMLYTPLVNDMCAREVSEDELEELLKLQDKDRAKVSRLFADLVNDGEIVQTEDSIPNNVKYKRLRKK